MNNMWDTVQTWPMIRLNLLNIGNPAKAPKWGRNREANGTDPNFETIVNMEI